MPYIPPLPNEITLHRTDTTATPAVSVGSGSNVGNYFLSLSGGRAMIGFDHITGQFYMNAASAKIIDFYVNGVAGTLQSGIKALELTTTGDALFYSSVLSAGGIAQTKAPVNDVSITANYSMIINRKYRIASGKKVSLGSGAQLRIL